LENRPLGRSGINVSALCLGTMMYGDQIDRKEAFNQMDRCLDRDINFFDTAELYTIPPKADTSGESERIVGEWMAERGTRDRLILATKVVGRSNMPWIRDGEESRLNKSHIKRAIDGSLRNLQTDYIDLYQTHWPDRRVQLFGSNARGYKHYKDDYIQIEETLSALHDLQKEGKIRHYGVSNETAYGVMSAIHTAEEKSLPRAQSIQNAYSLVNRTFETGLAEIALQENVGLLAYSPIAQGALTGKYLNNEKPEGSRGALFGRLERYQTPPADAAIRAYVDLAASLNVNPAALAMQFVTTRSFVTSNIFGASSQDQLDVIFQSLDLKWTDELENAINAIHATSPNPCP